MHKSPLLMTISLFDNCNFSSILTIWSFIFIFIFSCNSLFYDPFNRVIYDYIDGIKDLKTCKVIISKFFNVQNMYIFIPLNTMFLAILTCFCFVFIIIWSDAHCYSCPFIIHRRFRYVINVGLKILVILIAFACNYKHSYLVKWVLILNSKNITWSQDCCSPRIAVLM